LDGVARRGGAADCPRLRLRLRLRLAAAGATQRDCRQDLDRAVGARKCAAESDLRQRRAASVAAPGAVARHDDVCHRLACDPPPATFRSLPLSFGIDELGAVHLEHELAARTAQEGDVQCLPCDVGAAVYDGLRATAKAVGAQMRRVLDANHEELRRERLGRGDARRAHDRHRHLQLVDMRAPVGDEVLGVRTRRRGELRRAARESQPQPRPQHVWRRSLALPAREEGSAPRGLGLSPRYALGAAARAPGFLRVSYGAAGAALLNRAGSISAGWRQQ